MKNNKRYTFIDIKNDKEYWRRAIEYSALEKAVVGSHQDFWDEN